MNVQGFEELKRILANVPEGQLDMTNWNSCACGQCYTRRVVSISKASTHLLS